MTKSLFWEQVEPSFFLPLQKPRKLDSFSLNSHFFFRDSADNLKEFNCFLFESKIFVAHKNSDSCFAYMDVKNSFLKILPLTKV